MLLPFCKLKKYEFSRRINRSDVDGIDRSMGKFVRMLVLRKIPKFEENLGDGKTLPEVSRDIFVKRVSDDSSHHIQQQNRSILRHSYIGRRHPPSFLHRSFGAQNPRNPLTSVANNVVASQLRILLAALRTM